MPQPRRIAVNRRRDCRTGGRASSGGIRSVERNNAFRSLRSPGRRYFHRASRWVSSRTQLRQLHHYHPLGRKSLQSIGPGRATRPNQSRIPADLRGPCRAVVSPARGFSDDGPHADVAAGGYAAFKSVGKTPRGNGIFHSRAKRPLPTKAWQHSSAAAWAAKFSTGWSSRWLARFTPPIWKNSACWPPCPASAKWKFMYGSLIRAMRRQKKLNPQTSSESGARYSMFVTLRERTAKPGRCACRAPAGRCRSD